MRKIYSSFLLRKYYRAICCGNFLLYASVVLLIGLFVPSALNAQVGTPSFFNTIPNTTANSFPFNSTASNKIQWIYGPGAFTSDGTAGGTPLGPGNLITKLYIRIQTVNAATIYQPDLSIAMLHSGTSNSHGGTAATTVPFNTGLTTVFQSSAFQFTGITTGSWYGITLNTPFLYDPTQSLIIEVKSNLSIAGGNSVNNITTTGLNQRIYGGYASATGTVNTGLTPIGFDVIPAAACTAPPVPGTSVSNKSNVCSGENFILSLTGNSAGSGQTYQWQSSPNGSAPWTDIVGGDVFSFNTTQTVTTFYRCAVSCSGNTQYSTPSVQVTSPPLVSGTFTINNAQATGGTNFQSFADAINHIKCGINGPVVFNVVSGSGPYNEQVVIPQIFGTSAINTITFNGNDAIIQATPTTTDRHIIRLDGADYIRLKKLSIQTISGSTFGWGVHLTNGADNNLIDSCTIDISAVTSTTQSNSAGVVASGSNTSVTTAGNASNNTISNNTVIGAYQGIIMIGTATSQNALNNIITKNEVKNFLVTGIELTHHNGSVVSFNDIHRTNRTDIGTTVSQGIELGAGNINCTLNGNRIHDTHTSAATQSGTFYGIISNGNDATTGSENRIINNLIYNLNSLTGTQYGLYNTSSDGVRYYHNTVVMDHSASTAGLTRGFYQTTAATNIDIKNNIIYISRGGNGVKYCLYFGTTASTITSNNNILYNIASIGTNGIGSFGTAGSADLAAWQTANSAAYDQQSLSMDPQFTNPSTGDFTPGNTLANNTGVNVNVATDILNNPRSMTTPDAGAYEFSFIVAGVNMSAEALVTPAISASGCYTATESVTIRIRNNGTSTINFVTSPVTVTVNVTGGVTQMLTTIVNVGTLASGATIDVALPGVLNMSATGGYTFNAFTTVTADSNPADDAMVATDRTKLALDAGTATATPNTVCVSQPTAPVLSTNGMENGYSSLQWQQSATSGSGFTDIPAGTTVPFTADPVTQNTYYRLVAGCGSNTQNSAEVLVTFTNPQVISVTNGTRCGPGTVTLGATGSAGTTLKWYDVPTGGTSLATGNSFVTPPIANPTTYYVSASTGGSGTSTLGPLSPAIGTQSASNIAIGTQGMFFDVLAPSARIVSMDVYPTATIGSSFTIEIRNSGGTTIYTSPIFVTTVTGGTTPQTVTLNVDIPAGTNYRIGQGTAITLMRNTTGAVYPYSIPGVLSLTGNSFDPDYYYFYYNWQIVTGCESNRTPVSATINTAPAFSVTEDTVVCNNAITELTVTSSHPNYTSYIWSPSTGLFTDAAATIPYTGGSATTVYSKTTTAGIRTYNVNAANSSTLCTNIASVSVTVLPATLSIAATKTELCVSGTSTLSVPAGEYGNNIQWYSSPDGVTYSPIGGATSSSYVTPTLTATTYYKLEIKNGAGAVCLQPTIVITVNSPQVLTTAPATRCGPGTVTLGATGTAGSAINWYASASGGLSIATGNSFITPILNTPTTYYVAAGFNTSGPAATAAVGAGATTSATYSNPFYSLWSNTHNQHLIRASELNAANIGSGNITALALDITAAGTLPMIDLSIKLGTTAANDMSAFVSTSFTTVFTSASLLPVTGVNTMTFSTPFYWDGVSNLVIEICHGNPSSTATMSRTARVDNTSYISSIHTHSTTGTGGTAQCGNTTSNLTTYSVRPQFIFTYQGICESPRTPVIATVNPGPALSVAKDSLICNNAITALSVESTLADFDSYTWSPMAGLFTDAAATIPYIGGSATTLYAKIATAGIHKYYITANNSTTLCGNIDSVTLTVLPANLTLEATRTQICQSGATTLSVPSGEYGNSSLQWYSSPDGVGYSPIGGATSNTYTSPVLTATTHYRLEIKNGAGVVCLQPSITINVGIPTVVATASAVRCDPGTVTLGATPGPAGATINWYENASGGLPIATGNSFTTPVLNATTTYYASSGFGFTALSAGRPAPGTATNLAASPRGIQFNATEAVKLVSVKVFSTTADGGTGTIELRNSAGTLIGGPVNVSWGGGGTAANPIPYDLILNLDVPVGNGHRLLMATRTGGGIAYVTTGITGTWPTYSSAGGEIELTASMTSLTATSTTAYYYFFDWQITKGCESPRVPVDAIINGSITIDAAPINQTLCSGGQDVVFSVTANGAIDSYRWRKNGIDIPGANSAIYTIINASAADIGGYDVIVSGPCDADTSTVAILTINAAAAITSDPVAQQSCPGGTVTFSTSATGTGSLGYQWRKNGIDIIGAYGSTFTLTNVSAADVGNYDVVVTGICNKDTSNAAALVIGAVTTITTQPVTQVVCGGVNVNLTVVGAGSGILSYQWRKGGININGANSATYTINGVTVADAGNYDVVITGGCGSAISAVAGLTVNAATIITAQPLAQSSCNGSNVTFSVVATGSGVLTYQWRKGGVNIGGATSSSYTLNNISAADIGNYDVLITGVCGTVTSASAALTISTAGTWIGIQNTDWNNAANWCGTIPTSVTDVTIPASAPYMPVLSSTGSVRNVSIQNGASVTVALNGILNLYGNISGAGVFTATSGSIVFRGTTAQTVPAFTATNVTMNGAGGLTLAGNTSITGSLVLTNGHISLGSNDLTLAAGSTGSVASHIISNGNGRVVVAGLAASSSRTIPVGINAASYTPVVLTANPGHTTDNFFVRVLEHVLANGTSGSQLTRFVVDRTWMIDEAVLGGSNVNITVQWNANEELQDFGRNESYVMQHNGNTWVTGTESFAAGSDPFTQTKQNVTSFSPFAVQTDPLPIVIAGIFPNPTSSMLNIVVRTNAPENLTVSVYDLSGRLLRRQRQAVGFGGTLMSVDVTGLAAATYVVKITTPGNRELLVRKFVKVN